MEISKDLREFAALLNARGVKYLLVGGHAVAAHGYVRTTQDIDFYVERTPENAKLLMQVIADFGFSSLGFKESDILEPDTFLQIGYPPNRIDVMNSIPAVTFEEAWKDRHYVDIDNVKFSIISKEHLIRNKIATGRKKDLADADELAKLTRP